MVVILWSPTGLAGWDWFWLVMAVVIDVMHHSSTAYSNRYQIPGYKPATTAPGTPPPPPPAQPMQALGPVLLVRTASPENRNHDA